MAETTTESRLSFIDQQAAYNNTYYGEGKTAWEVEHLPRLTPTFLNRVIATGGEVILDPCGGNGVADIKMAIELETAGRGGKLKFVVVEASEQARIEAEQMISASGMEDVVSFVQMDAFDIASSPLLDPYRGRVDVFERYGLTTHAPRADSRYSIDSEDPQKNREKYWRDIRGILRPDGQFLVTTFSNLDKDFYDYVPCDIADGERAEFLVPQDHWMEKYRGTYQEFHDVNTLRMELEASKFAVDDIYIGRHPRPNVADKRYTLEVLCNASTRWHERPF